MKTNIKGLELVEVTAYKAIIQNNSNNSTRELVANDLDGIKIAINVWIKDQAYKVLEVNEFKTTKVI